VRRYLPLLLCLLLLPGLSAAQSSDRVDVFGGYSYISQDLSLTHALGNSGISGWNASATFAVKGGLGIVADFSGFYPSYNTGCGAECSSTARIHTLLFGPQVSIRRARWKPFARFLIGDTNMYTYAAGTNAYTFTSNNSLTFGVGGGVDFSLTRRLALRGQVDWLHSGFQTTDNQRTFEEIHNLARISTGIVFRF